MYRLIDKSYLFSRLNPRIPRVWDLTGLPLDHKSLASSEFVPFVVDDRSRLEGRYLYWLLQSKVFIARARGAVRAATKSRERVEKERLFEIPVPLPPLAEQRRIAAVLDKADGVRRKRRESLRLLDEFLRSAFLEMFGDPVKNDKGWETATLGETIAEGPQNGLYRPSSEYGSGTPIVRIDSFYDGAITKLESLKRVRIGEADVAQFGLREGDVLVNRVNSREFLGKSALVPALTEPTVYESNMMRFRVTADLLDPCYLVALLQTPFFRQQVARRTRDAVNQASFNQDDLRSFELRIPGLDLQRRYRKVKNQVLALQLTMRRAEQNADSLFDSLSQRAFGETGRR